MYIYSHHFFHRCKIAVLLFPIAFTPFFSIVARLQFCYSRLHLRNAHFRQLKPERPTDHRSHSTRAGPSIGVLKRESRKKLCLGTTHTVEIVRSSSIIMGGDSASSSSLAGSAPAASSSSAAVAAATDVNDEENYYSVEWGGFEEFAARTIK